MALPKFTTTKHTDQSAMRAIQKLLDGVEWSPTTVSAIASIVIDAGYHAIAPELDRNDY